MFKITCDTTPDVELFEVVRVNVSCGEAFVTALPAPPPQAKSVAKTAHVAPQKNSFFI
jgi:hypothetical protein